MQTRYYHRSTTSHKPSPLGMDYIHLHLFVIYLMHAIITSTNPTIIAWHHWCPTVERIHNTMMMYVSAMNWYWLVPLKYPCTTKGKREYVHAIHGSLLISSFKMYSHHALCCTCVYAAWPRVCKWQVWVVKMSAMLAVWLYMWGTALTLHTLKAPHARILALFPCSLVP